MGTNYYLYQKPDCECCGRPFEALHIGKSSYGWCFALHIDPDNGIETLDDWRHLWNKHGAIIRDEYGGVISVMDMERIILEREHPRGLARSNIDGRHCVGHGSGTYDYMLGYFS